jgi:hypothetical protein
MLEPEDLIKAIQIIVVLILGGYLILKIIDALNIL